MIRFCKLYYLYRKKKVKQSEKHSQYVLPRLKIAYFNQFLTNFQPSLNKKGNSPAAQCSSSAPFSQSRSPSHLHDNETHLLAEPPQSNFSGGHVCRPGVCVCVGGSVGGRGEGGGRKMQIKTEKEENRVGKMDGEREKREKSTKQF